MVRLSLLLLAALLVLPLPAAARKTCHGRFLVRDARLLAAVPALRAVVLGRGRVQLEDVCSAVRARMVHGRRGARMRASWRRCAALGGQVKLDAMIEGRCGTLRGRLVMRRPRPALPLVAELSVCGDAFVDRNGGESCEPPGSAACDARCRGIVGSEARCGNGVAEPDEQCDDGNQDDADGCTHECQAETCAGFESTFAVIARTIFEGRGCTSVACHDTAAQGGLDLRPGAAYGALVDARAQLGGGQDRVEPGDPAKSFLWRKLAAATLGLSGVPGLPMPSGRPPIPSPELDALRLWIVAGAPAAGIVPNTQPLLAACQPTRTPGCGDGTVDPGEECDDGNATPGDGCTACRHPRCGDAVVDSGEACDDGNGTAGDGCTACRLPRCGDAVKDPTEQCDDGNAVAGDGCTACLLPRCGDGILDPGEQCDDGDDADTDGCAGCELPGCGNGTRDNGEECDDGDDDDTDECRDCHLPRCGDGVVDEGEACDEPGPGCRACERPVCGDGVPDPGEECDDGNEIDDDGCTTACKEGCQGSFTSTWEAIQTVVFAGHGCTDSLCHGSDRPAGGLDLRPAAAYRALVDAASLGSPLKRVLPGDHAASFLYRKLELATRGLPPSGGEGSPMPVAPAPPLSPDELEAVKLWIRAGAPEAGVVEETEALLDACLPPPTPITIRAPNPPAPGTGVQLHAPAWPIPARAEREVCFATYYDFSTVVPQDLQVDCPPELGGTRPDAPKCFPYDRAELTQDPNSHHSIIHAYVGSHTITGANDPYFGPFTCRGGAQAGTPCNPVNLGAAAPAGAQCAGLGACGGAVRNTISCINYGPPDYGFDIGSGTANAPQVGGSQEPYSVTRYFPGVYNLLPLRGVTVWNSHAFNTTEQPTTNRQWWNLYFAADRTYPVRGIFDISAIFVQDVPPFETREYCHTHTLPAGAHLFQLTTHYHKRGKTFRIWGPPHDPCPTPSFLRGGTPDCPGPPPGEPLLTTTDYSDPAELHLETPLVPASSVPRDRTLKYCARYDNGAADPNEVKRRSTSPPGLGSFGIGGPCAVAETACMAGPRKGAVCGGNHALCDSDVGMGDGVCDACPLAGGVTTEDEMFILIGSYFIVP
jgi:cysteine-rich repeat protein